MGVAERIARLERAIAPKARTNASILAEVLRLSRVPVDEDEAAARELARHQVALAAEPPGEEASDLKRRLYTANLRMARLFFASSAERRQP